MNLRADSISLNEIAIAGGERCIATVQRGRCRTESISSRAPTTHSNCCDDKQTTKRIKRVAVGPCRIRHPQPACVLGDKDFALVVIQAGEYRSKPGARYPFEHRIVAFQDLQIFCLPDVEAPGSAGKEIVINLRLLDPIPGQRLPERFRSERGAVTAAVRQSFPHKTVRRRVPAQRHLYRETTSRFQISDQSWK